MAKLNGTTKVVTNEARMSYVNVFVPKKMEGAEGDEKYSASILIPKSDTETIQIIEKAIANAAEEGKHKHFNGKVPALYKQPLRDGDVEREDDEAYAGMMFFNASSKKKPGVVKKENGIGVEIQDEEEFYSGVWAKVAVNFYAYNSNGNKGVAAGLNNLLKVRDDERLSGSSDALSDFADEFDGDDSAGLLD